MRKEYLRPEEIQCIKTVLEMLLDGKFIPRLNMWSLHPNNIPRLESVMPLLNRRVSARAESGITTEKEYQEAVAAREAKVLSSRVLKTAIYKYRGPYCEGWQGGITNYIDVTYNYRITKNLRRTGLIFYAKGFYGAMETYNLSEIDGAGGWNPNKATAVVPDLDWKVKGLMVGIAMDM